MNRRDLLRKIGLGAAACAVGSAGAVAAVAEPPSEQPKECRTFGLSELVAFWLGELRKYEASLPEGWRRQLLAAVNIPFGTIPTSFYMKSGPAAGYIPRIIDLRQMIEQSYDPLVYLEPVRQLFRAYMRSCLASGMYGLEVPELKKPTATKIQSWMRENKLVALPGRVSSFDIKWSNTLAGASTTCVVDRAELTNEKLAYTLVGGCHSILLTMDKLVETAVASLRAVLPNDVPCVCQRYAPPELCVSKDRAFISFSMWLDTAGIVVPVRDADRVVFPV